MDDYHIILYERTVRPNFNTSTDNIKRTKMIKHKFCWLGVIISDFGNKNFCTAKQRRIETDWQHSRRSKNTSKA